MRFNHAPLAALCAAVLLSACAAPSARPGETSALLSGKGSIAPATFDATIIGRATTGDLIALPAANPLGRTRVSVGEPYRAASGRSCRRVFDASGAPTGRIVCAINEDTWTLVPGLEDRSAFAAPDTGQRMAESPVAAAADELYSLKPDETLWTFARRVTGNATNWSRIAEFNGIEDARVLSAGQALAVPAGLARAR